MNHQKRIQQEIIIFTRYPVPGLAKTRLIPELGAEGAAGIHRAMTEKIVATAKKIVAEQNILLSVYFDGGSHQLMERWLGPELNYYEQAGADLGQKMMNAFSEASDRGTTRTVLVGSDCPSIEKSVLIEALSALEGNQLVLGPATDGGYYLVGITSKLPVQTITHLFTNISWGSTEVFQTTISRAIQTGVTPSIMKELHDIDHPRDLAYFDHRPNP